MAQVWRRYEDGERRYGTDVRTESVLTVGAGVAQV